MNTKMTRTQYINTKLVNKTDYKRLNRSLLYVSTKKKKKKKKKKKIRYSICGKSSYKIFLRIQQRLI